MGPFRSPPKQIIDNGLWAWIQEHYDWVMTNRPDWWDKARLITPSRHHFRATRGTDQFMAEAVLADICTLTGQPNIFLLAPLAELPDELAHEYGKMSEVAGTYLHDDAQPVIQYSPRGLRRPVSFINTMVHEVMHARLAPYADALPGGYEMHELATDLHCIIAGFGAIQMTAAEESGWAGYMTQPARAVALAEFLHHKGLAPDSANPWLPLRSQTWLKKAQRDL